MERGICKLCREERDLCLSHVIPELAFADVYDEKHRVVQVSAEPEPIRYRQQGFRFPLLCVQCEQFINDEFEKPFKRMWVDSAPLPPTIVKRGYKVRVDNPQRFRLFMLSVVWRAAVCDQPPFANVNIGPHEEVLREKLLAVDPGPMTDYPIVALLPIMPEYREVAPLVVPPFAQIEGRGVESLNFTFAKCLWKILMTQTETDVLRRAHLRADGTLPVEAVDVLDIEQLRTVYFRHMEESERNGWTEPWNR